MTDSGRPASFYFLRFNMAEIISHEDMGNRVICDICGQEWTNRTEVGGFVLGSKAYCPDCSERILPNIMRHGEEDQIKAFCPPGKSFADFIRHFRGGPASITIVKCDSPEEFYRLLERKGISPLMN